MTSSGAPSLAETETGSAAPSTVIGDAPSATPATAGIPEISWSEHAFDGQVGAVAVDGTQLVAVGRTAEGLAAWTSPDGVTWERHAVPQSSTLNQWRENADPISLGIEPGFESMGPLARLGDTLFSFGTFAAMDNDVLQRNRPTAHRGNA